MRRRRLMEATSVRVDLAGTAKTAPGMPTSAPKVSDFDFSSVK